MLKRTIILTLFLCLAMGFWQGVNAQELRDQTSAVLLINAWKFFNEKDYENAIIHSDECIKRFSARASIMQKKLNDFPKGEAKDIHSYYALNDVATALYIKAESLRKLEKPEEAKEVLLDLIDNYSFGQTWDPRGWFWKPVVVAREKLNMLRSGKVYDFGDYSSQTLMVLAWKALDEGDKEAALIYTNKCINIYQDEAKLMQSKLEEVPQGAEDKIHAYWALNDVATAYFIQGESFFKNNDLDKAKEIYQKIIDEYPFAQCWDPRGWFWIVAEGALEKIEMIDTGLFMDYWDYSSGALVTKAWEAFKKRDLARTFGYAEKCIELYTPQAREMQSQLDAFPEGTDEEIHAYWALNDVATAHYLKGRAHLEKGDIEEAQKEFQIVQKEYYYGQCWDPNGWWWKPAIAAESFLH